MAIILDGTTGITASGSIATGEGTLKPLICGTAVTLTNQTSIEYTSLPSWIKRISYMLNGVSMTGTDQPIFQLGYGTTPTWVTSGYSGGSQSISTTPSSSATQPGTGFNLQSLNATNTLIGVMTIMLFDPSTNTWVASYNGYNNSTNFSWNAGAVTLSGTLSAVRLTRVGTTTFDAGSVNIIYE